MSDHNTHPTCDSTSSQPSASPPPVSSSSQPLSLSHPPCSSPQQCTNTEAHPSAEHIIEALQSVYHQSSNSFDGAATSLNAVLQGPYFDDNTLAQLTGGGAIDTYSINLALRSFNLSLQPLQSKVPQDPILLQNAFLCFHQGRWFTIRRIGAHWLNLSDFILRPAQILPWHLSTSLTQLQEDGCKVYAVSGNLPMCSADQTDFFNEHFLWYLDRGIVATDDAEEDLCDCEECEDQICDCEELAYEDTFEDDLQAAIAASLAELQLGKNGNGKPLSIKRSASPSMSMVSTVAGGVHGVSSSQSLGKREQQPPS